MRPRPRQRRRRHGVPPGQPPLRRRRARRGGRRAGAGHPAHRRAPVAGHKGAGPGGVRGARPGGGAAGRGAHARVPDPRGAAAQRAAPRGGGGSASQPRRLVPGGGDAVPARRRRHVQPDRPHRVRPLRGVRGRAHEHGHRAGQPLARDRLERAAVRPVRHPPIAAVPPGAVRGEEAGGLRQQRRGPRGARDEGHFQGRRCQDLPGPLLPLAPAVCGTHAQVSGPWRGAEGRGGEDGGRARRLARQGGRVLLDLGHVHLVWRLQHQHRHHR
mmetsp:Transcript_305/g.728  ORF Transcript_305/g.728 Transcript_305/m.728 type:complete len:271 (+) Transcript_305:1002-1814(+)